LNCNTYHKELVVLKSNIVNAIRILMKENNATESYYNKITGGTGSCESVPTAFVLSDMPNISFLSQTDQLSMEAEILEYGIPAIWTIGRSYRKEPKAGDGRHLSEFALLEFEAREMDLDGLLKFQQKLLNVCIEKALESPIISEEHKVRLRKFLSKPAKIISYTDVLKRLNDGGVSLKWGADFNSSIEEMVCLLFDGPVQVTHYPESIKFFNMYRSNRNPLELNLPIEEYNNKRYTVECADFLLPWSGECFGGSQREENYDTLNTKLRESLMFKQMVEIREEYEKDKYSSTEELKDAAWKPFVSYLELFNPKNPDRKSVTRSGFGLGMGRLIQFLLGSTEVVPF